MSRMLRTFPRTEGGQLVDVLHDRNVGRGTCQRKEVIAEREGGSGVIII